MSVWYRRHRKLLVALAGVAVSALVYLAGTDPRVQVIVQLATAAGVYQAPNTP